MIRITLALLLLASALQVTAQNIQMLPATSMDLQPAQLISTRTTLPSLNNNRAAVQFSWPANVATETVVAEPFTHQSRQYWLDVNSTELAAGIRIATTAPGAIIRVSPLSTDARNRPVEQLDIQLTVQGNRLAAGAGIESLADQAALNASGANFSAGTIAFRLSKSVGFGNVELALPAAAASSDQYVVHVFEPDSPAVLQLQTGRSSYLTGSTLTADLNLDGVIHNLSHSDIQGYLSSPQLDITLPARFTAKPNGGFSTTVRLPRDAHLDIAGLWTLHALVQTQDKHGLRIIRDAKTAVSITPATARLNGEVNLPNSTSLKAKPVSRGPAVDVIQALQVNMGVEVAVAGRYAITGTVYGTDAAGQLQSLAVTQSAVWLNSGHGSIDLSVAAELLKNSDLQAPYAIRNLRLQDQSRMGLLQTRAQGFNIR